MLAEHELRGMGGSSSRSKEHRLSILPGLFIRTHLLIFFFASSMIDVMLVVCFELLVINFCFFHYRA